MKSWDSTVIEQRLVLADVLEGSPGLKPNRASAFAAAYAAARKQAAGETGLRSSTFPGEPPFGIDRIEDDGWLPESLGKIRDAQSAA